MTETAPNAGFVYFFPNHEIPSPPKHFQQLHSPGISSIEYTNGPDGLSGFAFTRLDAKHATFSADQTWHKTPYISNSHPIYIRQVGTPKPEDLRRPVNDSPLVGMNVQLGDGNTWLVPLARLNERAFELSSQNNWEESDTFVDNRDQAIWDLLMSYEESRAASTSDADLDPKLGIDLAVAALSRMYYIGAFEIGLLGLLSTLNIHILALHIGEGVELPEKKKELASAST